MATLGIHPIIVSSGRAAVAAATAQPPFDLILMDCEMPEMDGYQATRAIRQHEQAAGHAPQRIVAVTAHALQAFEEQSRRAGMDGYLAKPIFLAELRALLEDK